MTVLEAKNLTYIYGEGTPFVKRAVDNVSFKIEGGSISGIIGHTGSGKSTLVQMLNGILKPKSGSVYLNGEDIFKSKKSLHEARFKVGLVFQYPEYQLFDETVRKDIAFGPVNMGLSQKEIEERTMEAIGFVGLSQDVLDKSPFDLSGGQKRRVAMAGVMVMRPEVLILDEPASGLDPMGKEAIFKGLMSYRDKTGAAVVIISHSMDDMARYAENIIVMNGGKSAFSGSAEEVFARADELVSMGLDIPTVTKMITKLKKAGMPLKCGIYTVEDAKKAICEAIENKGTGDIND